jgi:signal peptidase II
MEKRKYGVFGIVFALSLGADQLTKMWARASLRGSGPRTVIEGFFDLRYSENTGSAFGLFRGLSYAPYLLFAIGAAALVVIFAFLRKSPPDKLRIAAELGLLAGGAVGNIIDRAVFGRVTDFIVWKVHTHEWPTFNVADAALVVGVLALLLDSRHEDAPAGAAASEPGRRRK